MKKRVKSLLSITALWISLLLSSFSIVSADAALSLSVATDKVSYNAGEAVIVTATIKNNGSTSLSNFQIVADTAAALVGVDNREEKIETLSAGETVTVTRTLRAIEGGRPTLRVQVKSQNGTVLAEKQQHISVKGAGWYAGDNHTHSVYSDGGNTIAQNSASAYAEGLSWLYSTDHNNMAQFKEAAGVNATYLLGDFLNISGNEISSHNRGHAVGYRLPYAESSNFTTETPGGGNWYIDDLGSSGQNWQTIVDTVNGWGGIVYAAHPNGGKKTSQRITLSLDEIYHIKGLAGVEVWNASQRFDHPQNVGAFKIWDTLNVRGDKLLGIANSDAHGVPDIGSAHIKGYLTALTQKNIDQLLAGGSFYGTNGPDLWLDINGVGMGQTLKITGNTTTARITVKASDDKFPLTKITLYKLHVTGTVSEQAAFVDYQYSDNGYLYDVNDTIDTKTVVKTWDLTKQKCYTFSDTLELTSNHGDFFRIEVQSEKNTHYDNNVASAKNNGGFAYSNPIWVEKADKANDTYIQTLSVKGNRGTVAQTGSGQYYIIPQNSQAEFSASDLEVTLGGNAKLTSRIYHVDKKMFELILTAQDGSTKNLAIYVAAMPSATADFSKPFVPQNEVAATTATSVKTTTDARKKTTVLSTTTVAGGTSVAGDTQPSSTQTTMENMTTTVTQTINETKPFNVILLVAIIVVGLLLLGGIVVWLTVYKCKSKTRREAKI